MIKGKDDIWRMCPEDVRFTRDYAKLYGASKIESLIHNANQGIKKIFPEYCKETKNKES